ncbi:Uncharacterized protein SCF082_LOCUS8546 [Durusdinium trenchii]|uniref:Uncharacterized protein n=1 Tax=Durusdinium trenchii TaxID=1381693 RepID=A0ABP0IRW0_9DINO
MLLQVLLPEGFQRLSPEAHAQAFQSFVLEPMPLDPGTPRQVDLLFVASTGSQELHFQMGLVNTELAGQGTPRWTIQMLLSREPGADVLARSSDFGAYGVYFNLEVAGLYGSVPEVGYKYNFVRMTFRLPEGASMSTGGSLVVLAPSLFVLDPETFNRENLPPQSVANLDVGFSSIVWSRLNISLVYPLVVSHFYSFSFSVTNPSVADDTEDLHWEMCYERGRVVSANTRIPAFKLEAFFQRVEISPSSVLPGRSPNEVEVQVILGSTELHGRTSTLAIKLPGGFGVDQSLLGENLWWCQLGVETYNVGKVQSHGFVPRGLPSSSRCRLQQDLVLIDLTETLHLDVSYHFQLRLSNPLGIAVDNTWTFSTERDSSTLHLARSISNFDLYSLSNVGLFSSDVRQNLTQLILVQMTPPVHVMGFAQLRLRGPPEFQLSCSERGSTAPRGSLPLETECSLIGSALQMKLPEPLLFAPYQPQLLAGEAYVFGLYCINPPSSGTGRTFELEIYGLVATASQRLLGIEPSLVAPQLAQPLAYLEVSAPAEVIPASATLVTVRFQAPRGADGTVRAVLLEVAPGFRLSDGGNCISFSSAVLQPGDTVLPPSTCAPLDTSRVVVAMPSALPLMAEELGRIYVFQIGVIVPEQVLVDLILVALLPSPNSAPLYAASAGLGTQQGSLATVLPVAPLPQEWCWVCSSWVGRCICRGDGVRSWSWSWDCWS